MSIETLTVGVSTTLIGMGVVFSVLIILSIITGLVSKLQDGQGKKKAVQQNPNPAAPASRAADAGKVDAKTAAIIMAAVSSFSGQPITQLRFTSIKRCGSFNSTWSAAGTQEIINTRQQYL